MQISFMPTSRIRARGWGPLQHRGICMAGPMGGGGVAKADWPVFLRDLRVEVRESKYVEAIERETELAQAFNILTKEDKNSIVFVGQPGVGKTALMYTLVMETEKGRYPQFINHTLLTLDFAKLVEGPLAPGELEGRIIQLQTFLRQYPGKAIVFVDEIQRLFRLQGVGGAIIDSLKEDLARDSLTLVGTTTSKDFLKSVRMDSALQRRLNIIDLSEMSVDASTMILYASNEERQRFYSGQVGMRVVIPDSVIEEGARLAGEYIKDRFFPDKALDVVKGGCAIRINTLAQSKMLLEKIVGRIKIQFEKALRATKNNEPKQVVEAKKELVNLLAEYYRLKQTIAELEGEEIITISRDDLLAAVSDITKIPVAKLREDEREKLLRLEEILSHRIIGQGEAKSVVANAVRRARTIKIKGKPQAVFFFAGPTGVGKTELAKALAETLFGDEKFLIRIDMTEYKEPHSIARLIGSPPGYIGSDEGGQLTEAVKKMPYSVILFDEIEKAHPNIFNVLLQMLDDGRLTDGRGKTADFSNTIIIMTSNLAAAEIQELLAQVTDPEERLKKRRELFDVAVKQAFAPEFINRINETLHFNNLNQEEIGQILDLQIRRLAKQITDLGYEIEVSEGARAFLLKEGYNPEYGARPLNNALRKYLLEPLATAIIAESIPPRSVVKVVLEDGKLAFERIGEIKKLEFEIPQIEGRVGILVYRMLSLLDQRAQEGKTTTTKEEIEELLFPKDEKVAEALNRLVTEGIMPTGTVRLADNDFRRKDAAVMQLLPALKQLVEVSGFNSDVSQAALDFVYFLSAYAKQANVENSVMNKIPIIHFNFDGQSLTLTIRTSLLKPVSGLRKKIIDNMDIARPASEEAVRQAAEKLGHGADINLLELKRKLLKAGASFVFDDANKETVFYAQFRLFEERLAQDLGQGPQPIEPQQTNALPPNIVELLQFLAQDQLDLASEKQLGVVLKELPEETRQKVLGGLLRLAYVADKAMSIRLKALRVYCSVNPGKEAVIVVGRFLNKLSQEQEDCSNIVQLMMTDENSKYLSKAVLRVVFSSYAKRETSPVYQKYFDLVVGLVAQGKSKSGQALLGKWIESLPEAEQQEVRNRFFPGEIFPLAVALPTEFLENGEFIDLQDVGFGEAEYPAQPPQAPQAVEPEKPKVKGPNYEVNAEEGLVFNLSPQLVPSFLVGIGNVENLIQYLEALAKVVTEARKINNAASDCIGTIFKQSLAIMLKRTKKDKKVELLNQWLTVFNPIFLNGQTAAAKEIAKKIIQEIRKLRDSK